MTSNDKLIVSGYVFHNIEDANLADNERKKVDYLRAHLSTDDPDKILLVYKKAINDNLFKTPVGLDFLKEMRDYLVSTCDFSEEEVPPIPVETNYNIKLRDAYPKVKRRVSTKEDKNEKVSPLYISVVLNFLLVVAVVAMYVITLKSDNPNILNYETAINDKYSYWAEQLSEQESELRQKEKDLKLREEELKKKEEAAGGSED